MYARRDVSIGYSVTSVSTLYHRSMRLLAKISLKPGAVEGGRKRFIGRNVTRASACDLFRTEESMMLKVVLGGGPFVTAISFSEASGSFDGEELSGEKRDGWVGPLRRMVSTSVSVICRRGQGG